MDACALCLRPEKLQMSHIIPEFFYSSVYGPSHTFNVYRPDRLHLGPPLQKGLKERLLCRCCEGRLQKWEDWFARFWYGKVRALPDPAPPELTKLAVEYDKFKLTLLSILWRAGQSKQEAFRHVQLGPHAEVLRRMLWSSDPGGRDKYAVLAHILYWQHRSPAYEVVSSPTTGRQWGNRTYLFVFGGCAWYFFMSTANAVPPEISGTFLDPEGVLCLPALPLATFSPMKHLLDARRRLS